jgi:peptidyl-prolyl cis-trans isomerase SurA
MLMSRSKLRTMAMAVALVFAVSAIANVPSARAEIIERIVAIVNDDIITQSDVAKFTDRLKSGGLVDDLLVPDDNTRQSILKDSDKLLQKMIDAKLIDTEVKHQNLTVPIERVEQEIRSIAKQNNLTRDELKSALQERGMSFSQYQDFIKTGLERQQLIEKAITSRIKISEDDVVAAYSAESRDTNAKQSFEYTLAHIMFLNSNGGPEGARARAENVLKRLKEGTSFDKVASEYSEDPGFESGGVLGTFKTGELNKELEDVVSHLSTGEISGVIPTKGGFHIVRVMKKRLIPDPNLEKEKEKIRARIYEAAYKKQFQTWLEQLRQEAFIRINPK